MPPKYAYQIQIKQADAQGLWVDTGHTIDDKQEAEDYAKRVAGGGRRQGLFADARAVRTPKSDGFEDVLNDVTGKFLLWIALVFVASITAVPFILWLIDGRTYPRF